MISGAARWQINRGLPRTPRAAETMDTTAAAARSSRSRGCGSRPSRPPRPAWRWNRQGRRTNRAALLTPATSGLAGQRLGAESGRRPPLTPSTGSPPPTPAIVLQIAGCPGGYTTSRCLWCATEVAQVTRDGCLTCSLILLLPRDLFRHFLFFVRERVGEGKGEQSKLRFLKYY